MIATTAPRPALIPMAAKPSYLSYSIPPLFVAPRLIVKTEDFLSGNSMLDMFFNQRTHHPLRGLREQANITAAEEKRLKQVIVSLTNERRRAVLSEARK